MSDPNPTLDHILAALGEARRVLDIGCGNGALAGGLLKRGFAVTGVDPQPDQIALAQRRHPEAAFLTGTAEALPIAEGSFDAAVFLNALHHVPEPVMPDALHAALRALRPGGTLIVVEPLAEGSFFEAMRPVDDETVIRAAALAALDRLPHPGLCQLAEAKRFARTSHFPDLEAFLAYLRAADPAREGLIRQHRAAVTQAFTAHATPESAGFTLVQPMAIWVFRTPDAPAT